jgi:molybdenum cofactor biosynthesis enzyme MoaA
MAVDSLEKYVNSNLLTTVKQDWIEGKWPAGCERCRIEETNGIASKRQLDYERWQSHYEHYNINSDQEFLTASMAFGNTCNLKCITCSPQSSSKWQKEYFDIYNIDVKPVKFYKQNFVEEFANKTNGLIHLDIPGGEPLLTGVDEQRQLLQLYIQSGQADKISLHYTTNATVFPDQTWWDLWQHFKEIDLQISVDGVGHRFEYIRYPASWSEVEDNINKYLSIDASNFRISVSHTISAYNIYYLDEFVSWCHNMNLPKPWMGKVHTPAHMRPGVWPAEIRQLISQHLNQSQHTEVLTWAKAMQNLDESVYWHDFLQYLKQHDQHRSLDFCKTFPELALFVK